MSTAHAGHEHMHGMAKQTLRLAFFLTMIIIAAEVAGGVLAHSLALLSDAGHALTDIFALGLAWFATAQTERARALIALGQGQTTKEAFASYVDKLLAGDERNSSIRLELARLHMTLGETGAAKAVLEQARQLRPRDQEVNARLTEISSLAAKAYPLPLARKIVEQSQAIPGW